MPSSSDMSTANEAFAALDGVWENKFAGTWRDDHGWHVISQPKLGVSGEFELRFDPMRETISFGLLGDPEALPNPA